MLLYQKRKRSEIGKEVLLMQHTNEDCCCRRNIAPVEYRNHPKGIVCSGIRSLNIARSVNIKVEMILYCEQKDIS